MRGEKRSQKQNSQKPSAVQNSRLRTYLTSLLSLAFCAIMFLGATIAWFTDEVGSKGNKIMIGELDVSLLYGEENIDLADPENESQSILDENVKWAPGHLELRELGVRNNGELPFTYSLGMRLQNADGEHISQKDAETAAVSEEGTAAVNPYTLAEYFDVYAIDTEEIGEDEETPTIETIKEEDSKWVYAGKLSDILKGKSMYQNNLEAKEENAEEGPLKAMYFAVYMNPSTPSTYIGESLENIYIYLRACQTIEKVDTPVMVSTLEELENALATGGSFVLSQDISIGEETLTVPENRTVLLNLNGKTLSGNGEVLFTVAGNLTLESGNVIYEGTGTMAKVESTGTVTVNNGTYTASGETGTVYDVDGGTLQYNGGSAAAPESCIVVHNGGKLTIEDGVFKSTKASVVVVEDTSIITVNGGTFRASNEVEGNIACGIELKGTETAKIFSGTFQIQDGVGVFVNSGSLLIKKGIVFVHSMTGETAVTGNLSDKNGSFTAGSDVIKMQEASVEQPDGTLYTVTEVVTVEATME